MDDEANVNEAARLNSLAQTSEHGSLGALEELWDRSPGLIDSLPFMGSGEQVEAARAYVYASGIWLKSAEDLYPKVVGLSPDTVGLLAENIARTKAHREFLIRLGYTPTLDNVTGKLADLAKKVKDNAPGFGSGLALGVVGVVLILLAILVVKRR